MHNLLQKMEAELNRQHAVSKASLDQPSLRIDAIAKIEKLRVLIKKYTEIEAQFRELTGALSINY